MSRIGAGVGWALAAIPSIVRELREAPQEALPILVSGPKALAVELRAKLAAGGGASFVRLLDLATLDRDAGSVLVHMTRGWPTSVDEETLQLADRAGIPIVCLVLGERPVKGRVFPYVKATDVVYADALDERALDAVVGRIAAVAGEQASALARELPLLRSHVARSLIGHYSKRNAIVSAAIFIPGADLPVLTLNQLRMVRRIADAYGVDERQSRALMLAGVVGAGLGFRTIARTALGFVPFAGMPIRAGVAFGGTRALGEAAIRRLEHTTREESEEAAARLQAAFESTEPGSGERDLDTQN